MADTTLITRTVPQTKAAPAAGLLGTLVRLLAETWTRHRNRRAIGKLMALEPDALKDIGLTRGDVAGALALPLSRDPSRHLAESLAERRRFQRLARLCR